MATVREIANRAGVSKSTVSLVLNNKPGVRDKKRERVLSAKRELEALEAARQPVERTSESGGASVGRHEKKLSIVVFHPVVLESSYVFREVLRGIQNTAQAHNIQISLIPNEPEATEQHVANLYFSDKYLRPDGVLIFGARRHEPLIDKMGELGVPCVVLGRDAGKYDISGIGRNEYRYGYMATKYLIDRGHRNIGFAGGESDYDYLYNRLNGYRQALEDAGIQVVEDWVAFGTGDAATAAILAQAEITGLIYVNDVCAAEGLPVLENAGLHIPADISVISFDDTDFARTYSPALTSVSYQLFEEGQWAVRLLMDQVQYPYIERAHVQFKAELIERDSCRPLKTSGGV